MLLCRWLLLLSALCVAGPACDDGTDLPDARGATDSGVVTDSGPPPDVDSGPAEAGLDAGSDAGSDAGADAADAGVGFDAGASCPPAGASTLFVDCAFQRGIGFTSQLRIPVLVAGGVAIFDADGDGDEDLFFTGELLPSAFYRNDGTGHFSDATVAAGLDGVDWARGVAAVDYDNDGDQDLYVGRLGANMLFKNLGGGVFTEIAAAAGVDNPEMTLGAVWGDYDSDGDLDLYTSNYLVDQYSRGYPEFPGPPNNLYRNNGDGTFTDIAPAAGVASIGATLGVAFTDYDNDGDLDLVEVNDYGMGPGAEHNTIYRNDGPGGPAGWLFADVGTTIGFGAGTFGMSAIPGDYDNDGWIDIYASNICRNTLHHNLGGTFEEISDVAGIPGYGYYDPSEPFTGWPNPDPMGDVFQQGMVTYLLLYTDASSTELCTTSWGGGFYDFDHDGWQDFYLSNGYVKAFPYLPEGHSQPNFTYLNNADGTFTDITVVSGGDTTLESRGVAFGDLDGDGDIDVVVHNCGMTGPPQRPSVLFNVGSSGSWLKVELEGIVTNRDGIGARVEVWVGSAYQMREISGGSGSFSRSSLDAHFGLGGATLVDTMVVSWPSGIVDTFTNLAVDQEVLVVEGSSP